jgi:opacity protein-like surface antigen
MAVDGRATPLSDAEAMRAAEADSRKKTRDTMRRMRVWMIAIGVLVALSVSDASAQTPTYRGYATAFIGAVAGGDLPRGSFAVGGAVSVSDDSGWGADLDFSFSDDHSASRPADELAFMVNVNWTKLAGVWKPYFSGGVGVLRLHGCLSGCPEIITATDFGLNVGGGAYVAVNEIVFVRGEVKYLWAPGQHPDLSRPDNYGFFRATVGVTLTWTLVD